MYSVLVLEYIHKVLVLSEYILFHEQKSCSHVIILISMILMIYICILQRMMCTVIYQYHASCFFSPILVYVHIYQILCYMDLLASWFAPIKHPYCESVQADDHDNGIPLTFNTPYHHSPWGSGDLSRLLSIWN